MINVNSIPSVAVFVDETPFGFTPKKDIVVKAGDHKVRFGEPAGSAKVVHLSCAAGETKTVAVRIQQ